MHWVVKKKTQLEAARGSQLQGLEKTHERYLAPDYQSPSRGNGFISGRD